MTNRHDFAGTVPVREQHQFDQTALERWMEQNVAGYAGPLTVDQFKGGQSNPTYRLTTPGRSYVLRRKPRGALLKGAHAVEREARVMAALGQADFPVPYIHGLCIDDSVIGSWIFVMDMIEGRIFWDASFSDVSRHDRAAYMDAMPRSCMASRAELRAARRPMRTRMLWANALRAWPSWLGRRRNGWIESWTKISCWHICGAHWWSRPGCPAASTHTYRPGNGPMRPFHPRDTLGGAIVLTSRPHF